MMGFRSYGQRVSVPGRVLRRRLCPAVRVLLVGCLVLLVLPLWAQRPVGHFLTDSIEIGRPFRYALTYRHAPGIDVLFPDTSRHFAPYRVQDVAVFTTETTGSGPKAVSCDSAVYTLVSFETDSAQLLQVPVRLLNPMDCTALFTQPDTIFLRSKLPRTLVDSTGIQSLNLATATKLAPLQQQLNYPVLVIGVVLLFLAGSVIYSVFGRILERQARLYRLNRRHLRFLREYNRLSRNSNPVTAADTANQAVVLWKTYLERLERRPYASLTTPEIAEQVNDERVANALREVDRMIYGGSYSPESQPALRVLSDVATQAYHRQRTTLQKADQRIASPVQANPADPFPIT